MEPVERESQLPVGKVRYGRSADQPSAFVVATLKNHTNGTNETTAAEARW